MPHRPKSRGAVLAIVGVPLLLALYVLSIGPVLRLDMDAKDSRYAGPLGKPWHAIYKPIIWTCLQSEPSEKVFNWYLNQWVPSGTRVYFGHENGPADELGSP